MYKYKYFFKKVTLNLLLLLITQYMLAQSKNEFPFALKSGDTIKLHLNNSSKVIFVSKFSNNRFELIADSENKPNYDKTYPLFRIKKLKNNSKTIFDGDEVQFTLLCSLNESPNIQQENNMQLCSVSNLRRGNLQQNLSLNPLNNLNLFENNKNKTISLNFIIRKYTNEKNEKFKPILSTDYIEILTTNPPKKLMLKSPNFNELTVEEDNPKDKNTQKCIFKIEKFNEQDLWTYSGIKFDETLATLNTSNQPSIELIFNLLKSSQISIVKLNKKKLSDLIQNLIFNSKTSDLSQQIELRQLIAFILQNFEFLNENDYLTTKLEEINRKLTQFALKYDDIIKLQTEIKQSFTDNGDTFLIKSKNGKKGTVMYSDEFELIPAPEKIVNKDSRLIVKNVNLGKKFAKLAIHKKDQAIFSCKPISKALKGPILPNEYVYLWNKAHNNFLCNMNNKIGSVLIQDQTCKNCSLFKINKITLKKEKNLALQLKNAQNLSGLKQIQKYEKILKKTYSLNEKNIVLQNLKNLLKDRLSEVNYLKNLLINSMENGWENKFKSV